MKMEEKKNYNDIYSKRKLANAERCSDCKKLIYYDWQIGGKKGNKYICKKCKQRRKKNQNLKEKKYT